MDTKQLSCHLVPLLAIAGYMAYPKQMRIDPTLLHYCSIAHNGLLVAFSAYTFMSLSHILYTDGIVFRSSYYFQNPYFDRVIYWFYLSKYYEFFDTFLLYLNGKTPIFLQKFHHIGAVIVWHLCYVYNVDCIWIPSIANSFVHTIMYSYYLGCLLKVNKVRFIKQYITSMQLTQLIVPNFICLYFYIPPIETQFKYGIIQLFVGYVSILVVLFSNFYWMNYMKPKSQ
jgi:hypothetical protein